MPFALALGCSDGVVVLLNTWQIAQHHLKVIAQQVGERPAQHAVADTAGTEALASQGRTHIRLNPRPVAVVVGM